tara:strand:- start:1035 stop:1535 length:501 start_codon:yes stop_codon:yes gene_type:complete
VSKLILIAAAGENQALGKNNDLLWHLPDDFKRFKKLTTGHPIIMGRKTFESFPKTLPNRWHVIVTRDRDYKVPFENCTVVHSIENALEMVAQEPLAFVIGGGEIYRQAEKFANGIELTRVHATFDSADTYFPELDPSIWEKVAEEYHAKDEKHAFAFTFLTYVRKS